jgi:Mn2+/Fe2+ NRAMP family transporter
LAGVLRQHYPRSVLYFAVLGLLIANTINAGADIGAVAAGINLLLPIPVHLLIVPIGVLLLIVQVLGSYRVLAKILKWLTLSLFVYIGASFLARLNWNDVLRHTLIPTFSFDSSLLTILIAILGTTISPYLFFWQASQEVEELTNGQKRLWQRKRPNDEDLQYAAWDVNTGMLLSNVVMYFIILATAATLHKTGQTDINTAADAAAALRPLSGNAAYVLMALGLIGSGLLAIPILTTSGAYAVCETFGWKWGLDEKFRRAKQFYVVIAVYTLVGLLINFMDINPMDALFWAAVVNGLIAPPLLFIIMLVANNKRIMGKRVNGLVLMH